MVRESVKSGRTGGRERSVSKSKCDSTTMSGKFQEMTVRHFLDVFVKDD